jgi:hypothetical protein
MHSRTSNGCGRTPEVKESLISGMDLSEEDKTILQIIRFYMQSVTYPKALSWMAAFSIADMTFGPVHGPQIAVRALDVLQQVRLSRRSVFNFNSPTCPTCRQIITEHERRFMVALNCVKDGLAGQAQIEMIMLCEGNDVNRAIIAMDSLNALIQAFQRPDALLPDMPNARTVQRTL